jgi:hypothetical protein
VSGFPKFATTLAAPSNANFGIKGTLGRVLVNVQIGGPLSGGTGRNMLRLSSSQFDPNRTSGLIGPKVRNQLLRHKCTNFGFGH